MQKSQPMVYDQIFEISGQQRPFSNLKEHYDSKKKKTLEKATTSMVLKSSDTKRKQTETKFKQQPVITC